MCVPLQAASSSSSQRILEELLSSARTFKQTLRTSSFYLNKDGVRWGWEWIGRLAENRVTGPHHGQCAARVWTEDVVEGHGCQRQSYLAPLPFCYTIKPTCILNSKIKRKDYKDWYYGVLQKVWRNSFLSTMGVGVNWYLFKRSFWLFLLQFKYWSSLTQQC